MAREITVAQFIKEFEAEKDFIFNEANKRVARLLVRRAPILEGEFLGDWDIGVNRAPGDQKRLEPIRSVARSRFDVAVQTVKFGDYVVYENRDPVSVALEFGFSKKVKNSGAGMVRLAGQRWRGFVKGAGRAAEKKILSRER